MNPLKTSIIQCPYCWQSIEIILDCSVEHQEYTEDCEVCCHPILMDILIDQAGNPQVTVEREN
jgi:hypothetical protein